MKRRDRIRVFLGGYINSTNAQNLNCLALAQHLDKDLFEVAAMSLYSGDLELPDDPPRLFHCGYPHRLTRIWSYLRALAWCDVAWLPKRELPGFCRLLAAALGKQTFTTVESISDDARLADVLAAHGSVKAGHTSYRQWRRHYAISGYVRKYHEKRHGLRCEAEVLTLGVDSTLFSPASQPSAELHKLVFVGRMLRRKGIFEMLEVAGRFPSLDFHFVGEGEDLASFLTAAEGLSNIFYLGRVTHRELARLFKDMDVHLLLSRSEGFPKVVLEAACAGVPSIVYPDYGAAEWITPGVNGLIVEDVDTACETLAMLCSHPENLSSLRAGARELGVRHDWQHTVGAWERVLLDLAGRGASPMPG